jgi:hypothetical protein
MARPSVIESSSGPDIPQDTIEEEDDLVGTPMPEASTSKGKRPEKSSEKRSKERRSTFNVEKPDDTPELLQFITCNEPQQIEAMTTQQLYRAARDAATTLEEWQSYIADADIKRGDAVFAAQEAALKIQQLERDIIGKNAIIEFMAKNQGGPVTTTPALEAMAKVLIAKIPDPPAFTGDKDSMGIEEWASKIRRKLKVNKAYYPDEETRIAHVYSLVEGSALPHLEPRLMDDAANPYTTAEQLLETLFQAFGDLNKKETTREEYRKLYQNDKPFPEFWAKFLRLATMLKVDDEQQQTDLRLKVNDELKAQISSIFDVRDVADLATKCRIIDFRLGNIRKDKQRRTGGGGNRGTGGSGQSDSKKPGTTGVPPNQSAIDQQGSSSSNSNSNNNNSSGRGRSATPRQPWTDERKQEFAAGVCFYCKKKGHLARDCPTKNNKIHEISSGVGGESGSTVGLGPSTSDQQLN